jgi:inhibitor of the pro-sigma K processing machinery
MVLEIATGFIAGIILIALMCWLFKAKMKWYVRFLASSALGFAVLAAFNVFNLIALPVNPLNAFLTGFLGVPGMVLLFLITNVF